MKLSANSQDRHRLVSWALGNKKYGKLREIDSLIERKIDKQINIYIQSQGKREKGERRWMERKGERE